MKQGYFRVCALNEGTQKLLEWNNLILAYRNVLRREEDNFIEVVKIHIGKTLDFERSGKPRHRMEIHRLETAGIEEAKLSD